MTTSKALDIIAAHFSMSDNKDYDKGFNDAIKTCIEILTPKKDNPFIKAFRNKITGSIDWRGKHDFATVYSDSYYLEQPELWEPIFDDDKI